MHIESLSSRRDLLASGVLLAVGSTFAGCAESNAQTRSAPGEAAASAAHVTPLGATADAKAYRVVLEPGAQAMAGLYAFVNQEQLTRGMLTAVGSFSEAEIGNFDPATKSLRHNRVTEQSEIAAFNGNLSMRDGAPYLHVHVVLANVEGTCRGGHLYEATINPTFEVFFLGWK